MRISDWSSDVCSSDLAYGYDDLFVQETRLVSRHDGPIEWVAGFFYYDKRRTVDFAYRSNLKYLTENGLTGLPNEYYQRFESYTDQTEIAGFGEVTGRFSDSIWVPGGLSYGRTEELGNEVWRERG